MKLCDLEIHGKKYEVEVDTDGVFMARVGNATFYSTELEGLRKDLFDKVRSAGIKVRVNYVHVNSCTRGVATGIHPASGRVMARLQGDKAAKPLDAYTGETVGDLSEMDLAHLKALKHAVLESTGNLQRFLQIHHIDLVKEVGKALAKAVEEQKETKSSQPK